MLSKIKGAILFKGMLKRPDIEKAYAMVPPTDSWYATITKVHDSLAQIRKLPHQMLALTAHDGTVLKAIYYPGDKSSHMTVICIHGYTSHAEREWAFPGLFYHSLGYNVLIPYQRAHGLSGGKYISLGALEHRDMLGWVDKVNALDPEGNIVLHGLSMGGGIALDLTVKDMKNVRAIISDAPSDSIRDVFRGCAKYYIKKGSEKAAECAIARFEKVFGVDTGDFERLDTVARCRYPLLLSAGSKEDREEQFETLKDRNPMPTEILILPGCDHGNGMYKQTEMYQQAIKDFIRRATDPASPGRDACPDTV